MGHIILILSLLLTAATTACAATTDDPFPAVATAYILRIDGKTVWAHRAERRLHPASLTKIMTALIILEREDLDQVVTVSRGAAAESRTRIGLRRGDRLTVRDLLAATLVNSILRRPEAYHATLREASGNPVAVAVASIHEQTRVKEPGLERFLPLPLVSE